MAAPLAPVSGKTAYWEMYTSARNWSKDAQPLEVQSKEIPGIENADGKAAMWTAMFASPAKSEARVFTYAIAAKKPDIYKGVTIGRALPWNGPLGTDFHFRCARWPWIPMGRIKLPRLRPGNG